jgi:hypothetical protein
MALETVAVWHLCWEGECCGKEVRTQLARRTAREQVSYWLEGELDGMGWCPGGRCGVAVVEAGGGRPVRGKSGARPRSGLSARVVHGTKEEVESWR